MATGIAVGVFAFWLRRHAGVSFDERIDRWADDVATPFTDAVLRGITQLGGTVVIVSVGVVLAAWARIRRGTWIPAVFLTAVIAGQWLLSTAIKGSVERARPALAPRAAFAGPSFPSGHSTAAAACFLAFALVLTLGAGPRVRRTAAAIAAGLAVAVACSRVFLGVHWATDALAGLAIGATWYAVCAAIFGGRLLQPRVPTRAPEEGVPPSVDEPGTASTPSAPGTSTSA
jgi:undecaprenyl-diphosphatase